MCGIAGSTRTEPPALETMRARMVHRGPDSEGLWLEDAGAQPMVSDCGRYVLIYNGEAYNYRELRAELEAQGDRFRFSSDTEVLLNLWRRSGAQGVARHHGINGAFRKG